MDEVVIVDAARSASGRGKASGALAGLHPVDLIAQLVEAVVARTGIDPATVDDVILGCLSQAGTQAVNIARNVALAAGLPPTVPGVTIDRQCGSGLQALSLAAALIASGQAATVLVGGVEMMSRNPIGYATSGLDPFGERVRARFGSLVGQGVSAELVAARWGLDRASLDAFAAESHRRAAAAQASGAFDREILGVATADGAVHRHDETIRSGLDPAALAALPPAFADEAMSERFPEIDWRITAGNSSPYTDGASVLLVTSAREAERRGLTPRAVVRAVAVVGSDPIEMLTGVIPATAKVLRAAGLALDEIDVYEVNEAFAPVPLAWLAETGADPSRLNPRGGALALGHALGSTGSRLATTALHALEDSGGRHALIAICEGQGMANAAVLERVG